MIPAVAINSNTEGSDIVSSLADMAYNKAEDAARLKAIYERIVKARGESRADFGRRAGLGKPANVGHYLNGKNALDVDSARKFAAAIPCKIEDFSPHWARMAHASGQVALGEKLAPPIHGGNCVTNSGNPSSSDAHFVKHSDTTLKIPLLSWGQVDLMLENNEGLLGLEGVELIDADGEEVRARTKFIEMPDDSMEPRISAGDRLLIEPDWIAEPGEIVLIKDKHGEAYIRRYKQIRPGHFVAEPANAAAYALLDSQRDGLVVLGVVVARREFLAKRRR